MSCSAAADMARQAESWEAPVMGWGERRMAGSFLLASALASIGSAANNYSQPLDISALLNKFDILSLVNALNFVRP